MLIGCDRPCLVQAFFAKLGPAYQSGKREKRTRACKDSSVAYDAIVYPVWSLAVLYSHPCGVASSRSNSPPKAPHETTDGTYHGSSLSIEAFCERVVN